MTIRFLQDYTTQSIPPEKFKAGEEVNRSEASEQYFVKLGIAAYVTENGLVDQDHRPIAAQAATVVEVVTPGDRRFARVGRAGETVLGEDAPARATTGPGNLAMFGATTIAGSAVTVAGDQQTAAAGTEIERLTAELDDARLRFGEARDTVSAERDGLRRELDAERQAHAETRDVLDRAKGDLGKNEAGRVQAEESLKQAQAHIAELEAGAALREAKGGDSAPAATAKPRR